MKRWGYNVTAILPERLLYAYADVLLNPSKWKAIELALHRNREMRETVEVGPSSGGTAPLAHVAGVCLHGSDDYTSHRWRSRDHCSGAKPDGR